VVSNILAVFSGVRIEPINSAFFKNVELMGRFGVVHIAFARFAPLMPLYVDSLVPMLAKMHDKRMKGFKAMGYEQAS
jgi:hypothetical protein